MDFDLNLIFNKIKEEKSWSFELKEFPRNVIGALVEERKNILAVFPTGYGKSLLFIMTPLILNEVTL